MNNDLKAIIQIFAWIAVIVTILYFGEMVWNQEEEWEPQKQLGDCEYRWQHLAQTCWAFCEKEAVRTEYNILECKDLEGRNGVD